MRMFFRKHAGTFVVASVAAVVLGGVPAVAHFTSISGHDLNHLDKDYSKTWYRRSAAIGSPDGFVTYGEVSCPSNKIALGGGVFTSNVNMSMEASYPTIANGSGNAGFRGWAVWVRNSSGASGTFRVYVICRSTFKPISSNFLNGAPPVRPELQQKVKG